jgi:hypothetical protein
VLPPRCVVCVISYLLFLFSSSFSWGRLVPSVLCGLLSLIFGYLLPYLLPSYSALFWPPFWPLRSSSLRLHCVFLSLFAGLSPPSCLVVAPRFLLSVSSVVSSHLDSLMRLHSGYGPQMRRTDRASAMRYAMLCAMLCYALRISWPQEPRMPLSIYGHNKLPRQTTQTHTQQTHKQQQPVGSLLSLI